MSIFVRRWTWRGHDMIFGHRWTMLLSAVHAVFLDRAPYIKENLYDFC